MFIRIFTIISHKQFDVTTPMFILIIFMTISYKQSKVTNPMFKNRWQYHPSADWGPSSPSEAKQTSDREGLLELVLEERRDGRPRRLPAHARAPARREGFREGSKPGSHKPQAEGTRT